MCDLIGQAINEAIERRRLLGGAGASILAAVLGKPASAAEVAQQGEDRAGEIRGGSV